MIWLAKQKIRANFLVAGTPGCLKVAGTIPKKPNNYMCKIISELLMLIFKISDGGTDGDNAVTAKVATRNRLSPVIRLDY